MNLREGRIGRQETISMTCIALVVSGLFCFDSYTAYARGNSTYVSLALSACIAAGAFILCACAIRTSGSSDIRDMLKKGVGEVGSLLITAIIIMSLIVIASIPLARIISIMRNYFYSNADYASLALYVLPVIVTLAWLGLETVSRVAKIFSMVLAAAHILILISAARNMHMYNIAPVLGDGTEHMLSFAVSGSVFFLPALFALLSVTRGTQGIKHASIAGYWAVAVAAVICCITQLILGLTFAYFDLARMYTPLFRTNMISGGEGFIIRLDEAAIFLWTLGILVSSAFHTYGASLLYTGMFRQHDIRPAICAISTLTVSLAIATDINLFNIAAGISFFQEYGFLVVLIPIIPASILAIVRSRAARSR